MVLNRIGDAVVVTLDRDTDAASLREAGRAIADDVHTHHHRRVVLDFGAVEILDSVDVGELDRITRTLQLMGAHVIVAGLRPEVVGALTIAGADLDAFRCELDVAAAMRRAR